MCAGGNSPLPHRLQLVLLAKFTFPHLGKSRARGVTEGRGYREITEGRPGSPRAGITRGRDHPEPGSPRTGITGGRDHREPGSPRAGITGSRSPPRAGLNRSGSTPSAPTDPYFAPRQNPEAQSLLRPPRPCRARGPVPPAPPAAPAVPAPAPFPVAPGPVPRLAPRTHRRCAARCPPRSLSALTSCRGRSNPRR